MMLATKERENIKEATVSKVLDQILVGVVQDSNKPIPPFNYIENTRRKDSLLPGKSLD